MKTVCLVLDYAPLFEPDRPLAGRTIDRWVADAVAQALPGVPVVRRGPWADAAGFVADLRLACEGFDEAVLVDAAAPFLRTDLMAEALETHRRYRADYTFADGYPQGFAPEVIRPGLWEALAAWTDRRPGPVHPGTLFSLLEVDINRFDVETLLSPVDLRGRRLSLRADSRRHRLLLDRLAPDTGLSTPDWVAHLEATPTQARTLPATLHLQITEGVLQVPLGSPHLSFVPDALTRRTVLERTTWNRRLTDALSLAGDLTVLPGFWGEPSLHPEVVGLFTDALAHPNLKLCVETSGLGWGGHDLEALASVADGRLDWIVELDSDQPEVYQAIRGEGFAEAQAFVQRLVALFPGHVWPQATRIAENEPEMEAFHRRWKAEAGQVIIQKHNDFGGRVERRKPSDLSPWKRHACWHLARDLAVFLDGTAVACRDDYGRTRPLGNVDSEAWAEVWNRGAPWFAEHAEGRWAGVCQLCDEWYTFHF